MFQNLIRLTLVALCGIWQVSGFAAPIQTPERQNITIPSRNPEQQPYEAPTLFAFSPDGKTLATGGENCQLLFWDVRTGKPKPGIERKLDGVYDIHFSPDGKLFATGTAYLVGVSLWNAQTGKLVRTLKEPYPLSKGAHVFDFGFSGDGKTIISSYCKDLQVWDVATGRLLRKLKSNKQQCALTISPNGKTVATASELAHNNDNWATKTVVNLWDINSGRIKKSRIGAGWPLTFSVDGRSLITRLVDAKNDNKVGLWAIASNSLSVISGDQMTANGDASPFAVSPDGLLMTTGQKDGNIRFRSSRNGALLQTLRAGQDMISGVAFSPDGSTFVSAGYKAHLKFWTVKGK